LRRRPLIQPPPGPRAVRADSTQIVAAITEAAIELGPDATLAAIGERAGVGMASLHRYFPTVAAIFAEVSRQSYRALLEQVRALAKRDDVTLRDMIRLVCSAALQGPGLSLEHRRKMNLEIPLLWSLAVAEPVYREIIETATDWIREHVDPVPAGLERRLFVAFGAIRGTVLMALAYPSLAPPTDELLSDLVAAADAIITGGSS
jgi:AcrR family transcriptional regulator